MINIAPDNVTGIYKNTLRTVIVSLKDGSVHRVHMSFKKFTNLQETLKNVHNKFNGTTN